MHRLASLIPRKRQLHDKLVDVARPEQTAGLEILDFLVRISRVDVSADVGGLKRPDDLFALR